MRAGSWESILQADIPLCISRVMTTETGPEPAAVAWPEPVVQAVNQRNSFAPISIAGLPIAATPPNDGRKPATPPPPIAPAVAVTVADADSRAQPAAVPDTVSVPSTLLDAAAAAEAASRRHTGITVSPAKPRRQARAAIRGGMTAALPSTEWGQWYGDFDIILDHFSRISQLRLTPHVSCATLYLVPVLTGC